MMSKTSLAFFNEPVLRGWCGFWIAPQPHRLGGPQARITRVVSTGDFSWPHAGTFTWPRTRRPTPAGGLALMPVRTTSSLQRGELGSVEGQRLDEGQRVVRRRGQG